ncbi:MAG: hypothetical protein HYS27_11145 [Deltaproteobacteria bacterium]|nr:hypothetical protein [Deltaproteobacteria bacterium]
MGHRALAACACAVALCAPAATAAPLSWLCSVEDGGTVAPGAVFDAAVVRKDGDRLLPVGAVTVTGATVRPSSDALVVPVRVRAPLAGTHTLVASGAGEEVRRSFVVAPLADLGVTVEPAQAAKTDGQTPPVTVRVAGGAAGVTPHLTASSGSLGALVDDGPGRWHAPYRSSGARFPEVIVITAARPWPDEGSPAFALAHAVLPLAAAIVLPGETRPAVEVRVRIGGVDFGPVRSDERGRFDIPVVVPPGVGTATGTSVDRLGTRRVTPIDLRLPPTNRIAVAAFPAELVAGEDAEAVIAVVVVDKTGAPGRDTPVVKARRGKVSELRAQQHGRFVARYTPPATPGPDVVEARLADRSLAEALLTVRAGPPAVVTATAAPALLPAPSSAHADVTVEVRDARGLVVPDAVVTARAARGGTVVQRGALGLAARYTPPARASPWTDAVQVGARAAAGTLAAAVALAPKGDGTVGLLAVDAVGRPVPHARLRVATGGLLRADVDGFLPVPVAPGRFAFHVEGSALPATVLIGRAPDGSLRGWPSHPGVRGAEVAIDLMEPTPVDVRVARTPDGALEWRVLGGGEGERTVALSRPGRAPLLVGRSGTLPIAADERLLPVTATDVDSGVSAVLAP